MNKKRFFASLVVGVAALSAAYGFGKHAKIDTTRLPASARAAVVQEHKALNEEFTNIFNLIKQGNTEEAKTALQKAYALADTLSHVDTKYKMLEAQLKVMDQMLGYVGSVYSQVLSNAFDQNLREYQKQGDMKTFLLQNTVLDYLREMCRFCANSEIAKQTPAFRDALITMIRTLCDERLQQLYGWRAQLIALIQTHPHADDLPIHLDGVNLQIRNLEGIQANLAAGVPI
jgi:hypothetical protein